MKKLINSIALVTPYFLPQAGGVPRHIFELAKAFRGLGLKVHIITTSKDKMQEEDIDAELKRKYNINVMRLRAPLSPLFSYRACSKIKSLVKRGEIDSVHFSNESGFSFYLSKVNVPSVTKVHGSWLYQGYDVWREFLKNEHHFFTRFYYTVLHTYINLVHRVAYKLAPTLIAVGKEVKEALHVHFDIPKHKIVVIPNGVNHDIFNHQHNRFKHRYIEELNLIGSDGAKIIVYVGDFSYLKGFQFIPLIIRKVLEKRKDILFLIVGAYTQRSYSKGVALLKGYETLKQNVRVLGFIPFEKMPMIYAVADVVILPYVGEVSNIHKEVISMGKPLVTFELRDIPTSLHRKIAMFAPRYDINTFIKYVLELLDDESLVQQISRNAAKYALRWSWTHVAQKTLRILEAQIN